MTRDDKRNLMQKLKGLLDKSVTAKRDTSHIASYDSWFNGRISAIREVMSIIKNGDNTKPKA